MRVLRPVTLSSAAALVAVVADSLHEIEPGLRELERAFVAGDALVDLVAIDGRRRLVAIVADPDGDAAAIVRALDATTWCREHEALLKRVFGAAGVDFTAPIRSVLVAPRIPEPCRRVLRALGPLGPAAVECRVFELGGERCVAYERVESPGRPEGGGRDGDGGSELAADSAVTEAAATSDTRPAEPGAAERAQRLISRLEALRFRQAFEG
jgi:hypothetical protein